ncbi:MAG: DJ-1 family glyoxalase III [Oscillospiraceae bacterium]|nr:DJ-1 family glyoxalase III [Oscillospiraceae bacterium]
MVYVFLAEGFEETEAVVPIDLLRRAGVKVRTVGVNSMTPTGSHGITFMTDISDETFFPEDKIEAILLPGGMPGTTNLENSETVKRAIRLASEKDITVAAICAAPSILAHAGLLAGKKATVYPSFVKELGDSYTDEAVVYDAPFLTARAAGSAVDFALRLIEIVKGKRASEKIAADICCK